MQNLDCKKEYVVMYEDGRQRICRPDWRGEVFLHTTTHCKKVASCWSISKCIKWKEVEYFELPMESK